MDGAGNKLLARSCVASYEDRRITRCDFGDARENSFQSGRCSNNLFKHRGFVDFFTQGNVFALQPVFRLLSILNVRRGNIPTRNLSLIVAQWVKTNQEPAIGPIALAHTQLQLASGATGPISTEIARRSFLVIRMNEQTRVKRMSQCLPPPFKTKADVIERNPVGIETFAIRSEYSNMLRNQIDHLPELHFLLPDLCLGALLFAQVEDEHHALLRALKQRASNQYGQSAAIFPEELLLVWLKNPGCQCLCQGTLVALAQFGRRQLRPPQSTRDEIRTAVSQHSQKCLVGLDYLTPDVRHEDSQNVGFDQAPDLVFGGLAFGDVGHSPDKLAIAGIIL